ncbi:hypothetical protein PC129_g13770 [Phytophthora cactorum]|uniref:Uncharacterized protein n=1 Tax=Phytophthora cactorum TaxID=29920 RepID=A0A329S068_9STRA|nr:hypothetical protein Pcac1_g27065 [Phytophthora cactorum]KAG2811844.1 hypothetical protein PC112_g15430 [Phytophthora cactorum]KAG2813285.1 hypothetical protein PC111_g14458 [Phytophthora cactorum]KAG2851853.1 hypothetical protein PC113_g15545 [Phytophthora cactorum]KAG2920448.1 hypothetical protein PC117_g16485 [Phytophthora cactorum]
MRAKPPRSPNLTAAQKAFAKQMAEAGMKPARIRTAMLQHFTLQPSDLSALQKVQNFVCYYRRTKLGGSDTTPSITGAIRALAFTGREKEHEPFAFGWDLDENGQLLVGNGSEAKPFLVGFTSKALLRQAAETHLSSSFTSMQPTRKIK